MHRIILELDRAEMDGLWKGAQEKFPQLAAIEELEIIEGEHVLAQAKTAVGRVSVVVKVQVSPPG